MSWNLPTTLATGNVLSSGNWDTVPADFTILQQFVALYARTGALTGSAPTAGVAPNFLIQAGRAVVSPAAGAFSFTMPALFPNGLLMCLMQPEGNSGAADSISIDSASDANTLVGIWWHGGSGYTASNQVVHFFAIGF